MRLFINKKNEGLTSWALNFDVDKDWNLNHETGFESLFHADR